LKRKWVLVVFPHAGGIGSSFFKLKPYLPDGVDLVCLDYPGKGERRDDPSGKCVQDLAAGQLKYLRFLYANPENRIAFLGYSLGGLVAYETACLLADEGREPEILFAAAIYPPPFQGKGDPLKKYYLLDDERFLDRMEKAMGLHLDLFKEPKFRRAFLPILRREIEIAEKYQFQPRSQLLSCRIMGLYGRKDKALFDTEKSLEDYRDRLNLWRELTRGDFTLHFMEGGHFFLMDDPAPGMVMINRELQDFSGEPAETAIKT
jgi:surfactin synthase thioesterase subunit